jgi:gliding motility-associated-like protein
MRALFFLLLLCFAGKVWAHGAKITFTENRGQWPAQVLYRANVPGGAVFVERAALTYVQYSGLDLHAHGQAATVNTPKGHAYRVHFADGRAIGHRGDLRQAHYENYYLGNDPAQWGTGCAVFGELLLQDVWPGIDLRIDGRHGFKYDLIVAPGADATRAKFRYEGQDHLHIKGRELHVELSTGLVVEEAPVVFSLAEADAQHPVAAHYALLDNELHFELPEGYDRSSTLVIDPILTFASFSGSTADNFGFTATYDDAGHTYGGGIAFGAGYPASVGAFDPTFNGGGIDVGVSKWTPTGNALVWSTYIGGNGSEAPHSLVVNENEELFIMGSTGSSNFPVTPGAFMGTFQAGPNIGLQSMYGNTVGSGYSNGSDVFVTRLNAGGTALIGSTYVGGSGTDGVNTSVLAYNYGDAFRGEVALDANGDPVVCTSTNSNNMPTTPGAPQTGSAGGGMDAFVFRLSADLTSMLWGSYHGGSGAESGHGVQFSTTGDVYITGGTNGTNLPVSGTPLQNTNSGGVDGFIARYSPDGTALLSSTYLGTSAYDQCFFVQLDSQDDVYVVGQTRGNYPVTPGVYVNPGSTQFIHKLSTDLSTTLWSTRIGSGNPTQDMSPAAFLVSDCGQIYFSGWAGDTNNGGAPTNSSTTGCPTTPDAFQSNTDGSDFYLMVLEPDAAGLSYATFFGGSADEHVDGGTSRFDKNGKVYQAVCAGCNGSFPTTPGSHATSNGNSNCNLGVFKFDLNIPMASIGIDGPSVICFPDDVQFVNNSVGGDTYAWSFGDGGTSSEFEPVHTYTEEGVFTVTMVMTDQFGCTQADTSAIQITSVQAPEASIAPIPTICAGGSIQLEASDGISWQWSPPLGLSSTTAQSPIASPDTNTTYTVIVTSDCGVDTAFVDVIIAEPSGTVQPDAEVCLGSSTTLGATGGVEYSWTPAATLSDPTSATPVATPLDTTTYVVLITTSDGCEISDSVTVNVVLSPPTPFLTDTTICVGTSAQLVGPEAVSYAWQPTAGITTLDLRDPIVTPTVSTWYVVVAFNICGAILDSSFVTVQVANAQAWPDTLICPGNPVQLFASGGVEYAWSPPDGLDDPARVDPIALTLDSITYTVLVTDALGCTATATVSIGLLPPPTVYAGLDRIIDPWDQTPLIAVPSEPGTVVWTPPIGLECDTCANTWAHPQQSTIYTVTFTADNGCTATDEVYVILNGSLFVPNTFTPNGDGVNEEFGIWGTELAEMQLMVFNRWGELIFESEDINIRWDGTYKGVQSPVDTYVWKVQARELSGYRRAAIGHVNLVR